MGIGRFKDKLRDAVSGNRDKVDGSIDKAADFVDEKTGGKYNDKIDSGADKAKDYADKLDDENDNRS